MGAVDPPSRPSSPGELEIIGLIRRTVERSPAERVETGIGDDTAVLLPQPTEEVFLVMDCTRVPWMPGLKMAVRTNPSRF